MVLLGRIGVQPSFEGHVPALVDQGTAYPQGYLGVSAFTRTGVRIGPHGCPDRPGTGVRFQPFCTVRARREAERYHREQRIRQARLDDERRREYNRTHPFGHR